MDEELREEILDLLRAISNELKRIADAMTSKVEKSNEGHFPYGDWAGNTTHEIGRDAHG